MGNKQYGDEALMLEHVIISLTLLALVVSVLVQMADVTAEGRPSQDEYVCSCGSYSTAELSDGTARRDNGLCGDCAVGRACDRDWTGDLVKRYNCVKESR